MTDRRDEDAGKQADRASLVALGCPLLWFAAIGLFAAWLALR